MSAQFLLVGLPRSRTCWLSQLLAGGKRPVGHDLLVFCRSFDQFLDYYREGAVVGSCETAGMLGWRLFRAKMPHARVAIVRRAPHQVVESLKRQGWGDCSAEVALRNVMLDAMAKAPGVRSWEFEDLKVSEPVQDLVEFCTGEPWDRGLWESMKDTNIQIDLNERREYMREHAAELASGVASMYAEGAKLGSLRSLGLDS